jgi:hypothetical protein
MILSIAQLQLWLEVWCKIAIQNIVFAFMRAGVVGLDGLKSEAC